MSQHCPANIMNYEERLTLECLKGCVTVATVLETITRELGQVGYMTGDCGDYLVAPVDHSWALNILIYDDSYVNTVGPTVALLYDGIWDTHSLTIVSTHYELWSTLKDILALINTNTQGVHYATNQIN